MPRSARRSCFCSSGLSRLIGYAPHEAPAPTQADLEDAEKAIAAQTSTFPNLAFLRDKALLFDDTRSAFVMYAVQGRTWAALGDPVGPEERLSDVMRLFLERCADFGGDPRLLRSDEGASASLCRLRIDVRQARRGGESRSDDIHARRRAGVETPPGTSPTGEGRRRLPDRRTGGRAGDHERAAGGVRRLARGESGRREGLLAGVLRRGVPVAVPRRRDRARRADSGLCQSVARPSARRAVRRL